MNFTFSAVTNVLNDRSLVLKVSLTAAIVAIGVVTALHFGHASVSPLCNSSCSHGNAQWALPPIGQVGTTLEPR